VSSEVFHIIVHNIVQTNIRVLDKNMALSNSKSN